MEVDPARAEQLACLTDRLGIAVERLALLDRALTHASVAAEIPEPVHDYEALEFLGDAVLGLAVAHYLYEKFPDLTPGAYSRMRAGVVNRRSVASVAMSLDLAPVIRLGKGEELSGGRKRQALLADCLEAVIGALYLDCGWEATRAFVVRAFAEILDRESTSPPAWDFKSQLQSYCQGRHMALPHFVVVNSEGPDHRKAFEVEVLLAGKPAGRGRGSTKKEAEQQAAREALICEGQHVGEAGDVIDAPKAEGGKGSSWDS